MAPTIRAPRPDELEQCRAIERAAGALFAEAGYANVAADEPATIEALRGYLHAGRVWLITDDDDNNDTPAGFAFVDIVDGAAHLEQLSVLPDHGRRGLGAALLEHVCAWAARGQLGAVTLTTFRDIAWNAPFYAKHGFAVIDDEHIGPELRNRRAQEAANGLDADRRVCMRRSV